jgi:hypothetical protein
MRLKIIYGLLFIAAALAVAGFWFWQRNSFSTGSLKLEILAPAEITAGEEVTYVVKWKNFGETELENAALIFEYPEGAKPSEGGGIRVNKELDDINPGQEVTLRFIARLFGKQNELKEAKAYLTYTPRNLTSSFRSETSSTSVISTVPVNFELDMPSRIEAGQQFDIALNYFSNSEYPLSNLRIQMKYPEGFEFKSAVPSPLGESEWDIGVINRTEGRRIIITGVLRGNVQDVKLFEATFGSWEEGKFTILKEATKAMQITKPQLFITQTVNSSPSFVASVEDVLHYEIFFKNPTDKILENLFLAVTLDGRGFDLNTIKANGGQVRQGDNSILWEARDIPKLRFLGVGEEGRVEFWINVKDEIETFSPQDKGLVLKDRVLVSEATEEFEIKIASGLLLKQAGFFEDEVFGNLGAHPPVVGQKNTYTITWHASNRYNDIQNGRARARLPFGVSLTGKIFPEDATLTFDSNSREVVWEIGDMLAGTGVFSELPAPSVAFQIEFTPNVIHRGKAAELIGEVRITGDDLFTNQQVFSIDEAIDTTLPDDSSVTEEQGIVQ